jgi:hypothetical protein
MCIWIARQEQIGLARPQIYHHRNGKIVGVLLQEGDPTPIG